MCFIFIFKIWLSPAFVKFFQKYVVNAQFGVYKIIECHGFSKSFEHLSLDWKYIIKVLFLFFLGTI